jgi:hypothetical protein
VRFRGCAIALSLFLAAFAAAQTKTPALPASHAQDTGVGSSATRSITVKFDYDFRRTPACGEKVAKHCVQQFVVYDVSAGLPKRTKLFTIPVPDGSDRRALTGITGTSPHLVFESGKHELAVMAQTPDGSESLPRACTTWITIP